MHDYSFTDPEPTTAAKLLSHATGQSTSIKGKLALDEIVTANMKGKNGVLDLIEKICVSPIFLE